MKHYCPDDITELVPEKRKFGRAKKWFVCPKCGFRLQDTSSLGAIDFDHSSYIYMMNLCGGYKTLEY